MAYYNGFPATYQPYAQAYVPTQSPQAPTQNSPNSLVWIQGEQAAKSYLVAPNNTVVLFDSEAQTIYIKSADGSGMPSMKVLDYTIRETDKNSPISPVAAKAVDLSEYATKSEIKAVADEIAALKKKFKLMEVEDE